MKEKNLPPYMAKVLKLLQKKRSGVTFDDFRTGFRLSAVIFNLRDVGYPIMTIREPLSHGRGTYARYVLTGAKK
jgi:hypothetical protein